jgi:flagellin
VDSIAAAINTFTDVTGVTASSDGTGRLDLKSDVVGADEFVSIKVVDDGAIVGSDGVYALSATDTNTDDGAAATAFSAITNALKDSGQDVEATINGIVAVTKGTQASINTDFLSVEVELGLGGANPNAQNLGAISAFTIEGGGADFQLAGTVDIAGRVSLGVGNVAARSIGRSTNTAGTVFNLADLGAGKALNLEDGDLDTAQKAVRSAIKEVSTLRGRLGSFQQNTIGATIRSLGVSLENTTAAESAIRDTDFAAESAELTRSQILVSASTSALSIANSQPQNVLSLLG